MAGCELRAREALMTWCRLPSRQVAAGGGGPNREKQEEAQPS